VGWTEEQAAAEGIEYLAVSDTIRLMSDNERSVIDPEPTFLKSDHRLALSAFAGLPRRRRSCTGDRKYRRDCDECRLGR
jgi:hypothetical protein